MPHILVFDSGVGGTSVLNEVRAQIGDAHFSYVMDNALLPYGLQPQEVIKARVRQLIAWQNQALNQVDMIIIACNTASTYALEEARRYANVPVIGVVPAIKPAAATSQTKHIALLATPATSNNAYTKKLITDFAGDCKVTALHSTELVRIAEQLFWNGEINCAELQRELDNINIPKEVDRLVLGCTHFPLLAPALKKLLPTSMQLIDSGNAIARRAASLLAGDYVLLSEEVERIVGASDIDYYATAPIEQSQKAINCIKLESD